MAWQQRGVTAVLLAVFVLLAPRVSQAGSEEASSTKTLSPYFFVPGGDPSVDAFPLLETSVEADVAGVIASVVVRQVYKNDGSRPIHARYVFPGSTRAAVHGLVMRVGDKQVRAQIREKQQAQREFEQAQREGKTASLLTQERPNVFTMNVANVLPGDVVEVELKYSELLVPERGVYEWVYPTVVGPRYENGSSGTGPSASWIQSPFLKADAGQPGSDARPSVQLPNFRLRARLGAGMPIHELTSPSHKLAAKWMDASNVVAELTSDPGHANRDFVLRYRLAGGQVASGLLLSEASAATPATGSSQPASTEAERFFLLTVQPPQRVKASQIPPRDFVFVVDVSGSMHGFPLNTAKELLRSLAAGLRPVDTFNILFFSGGSQVLSPAPLPATPENVAKALNMLTRIEGGGSTELLPALKVALALPGNDELARSIVVITDGYVTVEREAFGLIRENLGRANLFAFGIGSSVNRHLIDGMARAGQGLPFVVLKPEESGPVAQRFREYIQTPVLTDVKVEYQGFTAYDIEPPALPDVLAERPVVLHGKYRGAPTGRIVVSGKTPSGPWSQVFELKNVKPSPANGSLRYLWARERVANLSDFNGGEVTDAERNEVVRLGLRYELLTQYTSFIAVLEQVRRTGADVASVQQASSLPEGVSELAVGGEAEQMAQGDEPELVWLLAGAALVAMAMLASKRRMAA